jgi:hypothetical protein
MGHFIKVTTLDVSGDVGIVGKVVMLLHRTGVEGAACALGESDEQLPHGARDEKLEYPAVLNADPQTHLSPASNSKARETCDVIMAPPHDTRQPKTDEGTRPASAGPLVTQLPTRSAG